MVITGAKIVPLWHSGTVFMKRCQVGEKEGPFSKWLHFWYGGTIFYLLGGRDTAPQWSHELHFWKDGTIFNPFFFAKTAPLWSRFDKWYHFGQRYLFLNMIFKGVHINYGTINNFSVGSKRYIGQKFIRFMTCNGVVNKLHLKNKLFCEIWAKTCLKMKIEIHHHDSLWKYYFQTSLHSLSTPKQGDNVLGSVRSSDSERSLG